MQSEIRKVTSIGINFVLRKKEKEKASVESFSLITILREWQITRDNCLTSISVFDDSLLSGIAFVGAKLMSIHNQEHNLFQHVNNILQLKEGCKKNCIVQFSFYTQLSALPSDSGFSWPLWRGLN